MNAYESCLSATSTQASPWYVVPADSKKNARLTPAVGAGLMAVSTVIVAINARLLRLKT